MKAGYVLLAVILLGMSDVDAVAQSNRLANPVKPDMRKALARINAIHSGMKPAVIAAAVTDLHADIAQLGPGFVPLAVPHLMRLAPRDGRTVALLHKALDKHWLDPYLARAFLVQAGDKPEQQVRELMKGLDSKDVNIRKRVISVLLGCGAAAVPALPKLRAIVAKTHPSKDELRRAYTLLDKVPEGVLAQWAIDRIEYVSKQKK